MKSHSTKEQYNTLYHLYRVYGEQTITHVAYKLGVDKLIIARAAISYFDATETIDKLELPLSERYKNN